MLDKYSLTTKILVQGRLKMRGLVKVFWILFSFCLLLILFKLLMEDKEGAIKSLRGLIIPCLLISIAYFNTKRTKYRPFDMNIEFYNNFMKVILPSIEMYRGQGLHSEVVEINYNEIEKMEYSIPLLCLRFYGRMRKIIYKKPDSYDEIASIDMDMKNNTYYVNIEEKDKEVLLEKLKRYSGKEINYLN
ncbi:hypothetical protein EDD66_101367 [Mobilisporobacter senegalensis]|uniref:Uncharacterized protein n=1 Tax=Mobilisporobacter senegalensis TaxID=1329262 RepID=A0A3N1XYV6_9FIRM|nr:hypothetical protein [Mobilisporobacter senegalensis]ROR31749.1 hypothetical protein EDD66_101367 [Mobilisporobacter senegalensis]